MFYQITILTITIWHFGVEIYKGGRWYLNHNYTRQSVDDMQNSWELEQELAIPPRRFGAKWAPYWP